MAIVRRIDAVRPSGGGLPDLRRLYARPLKLFIMTEFGLLTYRTPNLGDEIQSIAAAQFLPRIDHLVDRDRLGAAPECRLILNGWFLHATPSGSSGDWFVDWPPPSRVQPLFVSFHAHEVAHLTKPESIEYLKQHAPIGCRDLFTCDLLLSHGVPAYLSGCLTLTLCRNHDRRRHGVYLVDVPDRVRRVLPASLVDEAVVLTHATKERDSQKRMALARQLLRIYAEARLVVTGRLHAALPCAAYQTPVVLLHPHLDGDPRFSGLLPLLHCCKPQDFLEGKWSFDWHDPPPNPQQDLLDSFRNQLAATCRKFCHCPAIA